MTPEETIRWNRMAVALTEAEKKLESFHERIYDTFTCPNCRGSKTQLPGFMAESDALVPCDFCQGAGFVCFAGILETFDAIGRKLATAREACVFANKAIAGWMICGKMSDDCYSVQQTLSAVRREMESEAQIGADHAD